MQMLLLSGQPTLGDSYLQGRRAVGDGGTGVEAEGLEDAVKARKEEWVQVGSDLRPG